MAAVRQQILDAARAVFDRKGVADAVMSDIAAEAGLSVGSIYVHFRSKEDVLTRLIEQADTNVGPFEACETASELLGLIETIVKAQDAASAASLTALEVATIARRNPQIQGFVAANFDRLRTALFDAVARAGANNDQLDKTALKAIGEGLLSLLVAAQVKALLGVPPQTEAKIKTARWLVAILHGAPVRARR
ncbi:TetR/AcrR family transcriptional regulator [Roseateles chitosanitabidus]|uniref:TetR/AcrR family transcriptional regulator n=1 Tax=Roseateles chitosanitabidus TaxID=65048 RepID=UPI0008339D71|nr:TetR family transcriptional regulator [Roseateles chitosanitabidus]MBO9688208.1 TetR family transcriptional regulator [Roseateles chitosanitabidus]